MRRLLYVPVIHDEADMGAAGASLVQESAARWGERLWTIHKEMVDKFWDSLTTYFLSLDLSRARIYQDGLAVDGEAAKRVVEKAAARGSRNYRLLLRMIDQGAELRRAEDPALLLQERNNIFRLAAAKSDPELQQHLEEYRRQRDRLSKERDHSIAQAINSTLKEGDMGVLFVGAYHEVIPQLASDIEATIVKDQNMVTAYFRKLQQGRIDRRLGELARYLASPIKIAPPDSSSRRC